VNFFGFRQNLRPGNCVVWVSIPVRQAGELHMRLVPRTVLVSSAIVLVLAGVTVASASTSTAARKTPRCHTGELSLSLVKDTTKRQHNAGMSHHGATIALENISEHTCWVYGYPGVAMLSARTGHTISPGRSVRGNTWYANDQKPHVITLAPHRSAFAELGWTSADGTEPPVKTAWLVVTPPDERATRKVALSTDLGGDRLIDVTALSGSLIRLRG
jgi:hypothetical protein